MNPRASLLAAALCLTAGACSRHHHGRTGDPALQHPALRFEPVTEGVEYARFTRADPPLTYHVVKADLSRGRLRAGVLRPSPLARNGRETVGEMAQAATTPTRRVVAAINGDYYGNGMAGPWGIHAGEGCLLYSPLGRSAFLVDPEGRPFVGRPALALEIQFAGDSTWYPVLDMNRPGAGEAAGLHLYLNTGEFATAPATTCAAILDAGPPVLGGVVTGTMTRVFAEGRPVDLPSNGLVLASCGQPKGAPPASGFREGRAVAIRAATTPPATEAIGGGPRIVRNGRVSIELDPDGIGAVEAAYLKRVHPRSVAGVSRDRRTLFFVVVAGRSKESKGLGLEDLADLIVGLGAWEAVMFDGGDSVTLFMDQYVLRGRGGPRAMWNALALFEDRAAQPEGSP